jgi:hypothetical protein
MCKSLREITQRFALLSVLFRVKPEMIGIAQHPFNSSLAWSSFSGSARIERVSASTSQKEHMLKVPSSPGSPSMRGCGG